MALSEQEELELLTLEREKAMGQRSPMMMAQPQPNPYQRFSSPEDQSKPAMMSPRQMGIGKTGDTMERMRHAIDSAGYNAGGYVTDKTGSPALGYLSNVAVEAAPAVVGGEALKATSGAFQNFAKRLVQSAIKPTKQALETGKAEQAINTILEKNIPTTEAGMSGVQDRVSGLDKQVKDLISGSDARVSTQDAARRLIEEIKTTHDAPMMADKRNALVTKLEEFIAENPENMSVQRAQQLKQGAYRDLGSRPYMATQDQGVALSDQAKMLVARGLKDEVARGVPAVAPLNAQQSELLNVLKVAGPKLMMEGNKNPVSFGAFSPSWEKLLAWMIDRDAATKGLIARGLYSGSERIPQGLGNVLGGGVGAMTGNGPALNPYSSGSLYSYDPPTRGYPTGMLTAGTR